MKNTMETLSFVGSYPCEGNEASSRTKKEVRRSNLEKELLPDTMFAKGCGPSDLKRN